MEQGLDEPEEIMYIDNVCVGVAPHGIISGDNPSHSHTESVVWGQKDHNFVSC